MKFVPFLPIWIIIICAVVLLAAVVFCIIKKPYRKVRNFRRISIMALILLTLAHPVILGGHTERNNSNLNVHFIVDCTGSMVAKDMNGGTMRRYEVVKRDINDIIALFPGAKFSISVLDYSARSAMPLSSDANTVKAFADSLRPASTYYASDSSLKNMVENALERIKKYKERDAERANIAIIMTDGEDNASSGGVNISYEAGLLDGGSVIGYGSEAGVAIEFVNSSGEIDENYFVHENTTYKDHISKLNEANLNRIADTLSIPYYNRSNNTGLFDRTDNFINLEEVFKRDDSEADSYIELYWALFLVAFALLLWDFAGIIDGFLLERKAAK